MFNFIKKKIIEDRENDAQLFEYVLEEMEQGSIISSLWAKAIAYAEGNDNKIKPLYMQYRVQAIKDEFTKRNIAYNELKRDVLITKIKSIFTSENSIEENLQLSTATTTINEKEPNKEVYSDEEFEQEVKEAFEEVYGASEKEPIIRKEESINDVYSDEDMEKRIKEINEALRQSEKS